MGKFFLQGRDGTAVGWRFLVCIGVTCVFASEERSARNRKRGKAGDFLNDTVTRRSTYRLLLQRRLESLLAAILA
jgi:hypothetical protein